MRDIGFLSTDGVTVNPYRTSGESTHPMKERAILFIFELRKKRKKIKKNRAEVMERTDGRDKEWCVVFKLRQHGHAGFMRMHNAHVILHLQTENKKRVSNIGIIF